MRIELQVCDPPITAYHYHASPLAVALVDPEAYKELYSNYIQAFTIMRQDDGCEDTICNFRIYVPFKREIFFPSLHVFTAENARLELGNDILDYIRIHLKNEYYLDINVDNYYIPKTARYQKYHINHPVLVYGMDDERKIVNIMAFASPVDVAKFVRLEVSFEEFLYAYNSNEIEPGLLNGVGTYRIITFKRRPGPFIVNIDRIRCHIYDYLNSVDTVSREYPFSERWLKYSMGIDTYEKLIYFYNYAARIKKYTLITEMYMFHDHKTLMKSRLEYLMRNKILKVSDIIMSDFYEISDLAEILIELNIKANYKLEMNVDNGKEMKGIIKNFEKIRDLEINALTDFYEINRDVFDHIYD